MENNLTESVLHICNILNKHSVEYLIVGGTAVALHGFFRWSLSSSGKRAEKHDLDFWYNSTYVNYFRLLNALEDLGQDVTMYRSEVAPNPKESFFKMEYDKFTLDFLPQLEGLPKFRLSFNEREIKTLNQIDVPFISYDHLIINKETIGRPKDIEDIEQLKLIRYKRE